MKAAPKRQPQLLFGFFMQCMLSAKFAEFTKL
jgi:hypothetical protein